MQIVTHLPVAVCINNISYFTSPYSTHYTSFRYISQAVRLEMVNLSDNHLDLEVWYNTLLYTIPCHSVLHYRIIWHTTLYNANCAMLRYIVVMLQSGTSCGQQGLQRLLPAVECEDPEPRPKPHTPALPV
jgi:hypothetical protein